jgi:uncharacterized SAM-binding protein YcdF (DUF218 family)
MMPLQGENLLKPRRRGKPFRRFAVSLLFLLGAGAAYPHIFARGFPFGEGSTAEAILVPTGGEYRIQEGFRAWREGKGKELFVLGAGGGARLERILPEISSLAPAKQKLLHMEGWSENTIENAISAKAILSERRYAKVILLTSDYHMPRAYYAMRRVLPPAVSIRTISIRTDWSEKSAIPRHLRLFFVEGWKYWGYRLFFPWA